MTVSVEKEVAVRSLALVGHPNVGKSVIFNRLTGKYVTVSNYPGTTVDVARGVGAFAGARRQVVDTPGVHSLIPHSEDERVTRDVLLKDHPDTVVHVIDAKDLRRSLGLTLELAEYGLPLVVALNMMDEARDRGLAIDVARLEALLGVPVVATVATTGDGIAELKRAIARARVPAVSVDYPDELRRSLAVLEGLWRPEHPSRRAQALALLADDDTALTWGHLGAAPGFSEAAAADAAARERSRYARSPRTLAFAARERWAAAAAAETVRLEGQLSRRWSARLGQWCMRPWPGYAIAAAALYLVYQFVGVFGAGTAVDFMENTLFGAYLVPAAEKLVKAFFPWPFLQELLVGPYGAVSMALTYAFALILPIVATFFIAFGLLEDSGYLPRLSVMLDRVFRLMGLNGRAVLPLLLGLGCDTMATMTTRVLDTKKERLIVTILLSLSVPCSAQLAVILGMTAGLSPRVLMIWLSVLAGVTLATGWAASRLVPGSRAPFLMEIPPIRRPLLRNVLLKMKSRLAWYLKEVVPLFIWGTLLLFFLDKMGALAWLRDACAPVVQTFLGLPGEATEAFLIGFLRRDYGAAGLYQLQKRGLMDLRQVTVSLVLITLFMPCIAQWLMVIKERGWKWAAVITGTVLSVALLAAGALNGFLRLFPAILG